MSDPAPPVVTPDRASARAFVERWVRPRAAEFDRTGAVPDEVLRAVADAGLWAPFLPASSGGADVSMVELGALHEEVGRGCSSVRSLLTVHTMVTWAVHRWATPDQRTRWLPELATGRVRGAFCLTEPGGGGSDGARLRTTAVRTGSGWSVTGVKKWITGARTAGLFLVFAATDTGPVPFLVPRDAAGVHVRPIDYILGTRGSMLGEVELRDVHVDADALVGPASFSPGMVMTGALDLGRYSVAAGSVGIVQACLDACVAFTSRREVAGQPLRDLHLIRAKVTDMVTDVTAGRLLYERAGRLKDDRDPETIMATWLAKYFASTAAARHASEAVQIHGADGCGADEPVERYYRDAKIMEIIEGSTEIQRITIADHAYREAPL
ncbi:acyl-CoA dehydrogenase family protein [Micromonospora echinospora]|uniref:acyl-CoA dehydrogenase family protein n=1 Tax=Micromonospora echinospora TaxID=1877 RepID=UPI0037AB3CE2